MSKDGESGKKQHGKENRSKTLMNERSPDRGKNNIHE